MTPADAMGSLLMNESCLSADQSNNSSTYLARCAPQVHKKPKSGNLQARLEASVAGLEELNILRENQKTLVEQAKNMWVTKASRPEEGVQTPGNTYHTKGSRPEERAQTPGNTYHTKVSSYRSAGQRHSVSGATILRQKKEGIHSTLRDSGYEEGGQPVSRRASCSDFTRRLSSGGTHITQGAKLSVPPHRSLPVDRHLNSYKSNKNFRRRPLPPGSEEFIEKQLESKQIAGTQDHNNNEKVFIPDESEFSDIVQENLLTAFAQKYTQPTGLHGSQLIFHFPSPMHAVLLQYDKPGVKNKDSTDTVKDPSKESYRNRRGSPDGASPIRTATDRFTPEDDQILSDRTVKRLSGAAETHCRTKNLNSPVKRGDKVLSSNVGHENNTTSGGTVGSCKTKKAQSPNKTKTENDRQWSVSSSPKSPDTPSSRLSFSVSSPKSPDMTPSSRLSFRRSLTNIEEDSRSGISLGQSRMSDAASRRSSRALSTRSWASSRMSLTSTEEGYFSHPSSPKTRRRHKLSILSDVSFGSTGSNSFVGEPLGSDEDDFQVNSPTRIIPNKDINRHVVSPSKNTLYRQKERPNPLNLQKISCFRPFSPDIQDTFI